VEDDGTERFNRHAYSPLVSHSVAFFATSPGQPRDDTNSARRRTPHFDFLSILNVSNTDKNIHKKPKYALLILWMKICKETNKKDAASTEQE